MRRILRHRPSPAMVVACIALTIALGGTSYAAIRLPANSVGTTQLEKNAVTSAKVKNRSLLAVDFKSGQLRRGPVGAVGPQGPVGPQGSVGPQGPAGVAGPGARWATIGQGGFIQLQSGGIASSRVEQGSYIVNFKENVSRRLILASSAFVGDQTLRGNIIAGSCVDWTTFCTTYGVTDLQNSVAVFTLAPDNLSEESHAFYITAIGPAAG